MLVISNPPRASRSADLKLLARLLPELYSTRSNYYYLYPGHNQKLHKFHVKEFKTLKLYSTLSFDYSTFDVE